MMRWESLLKEPSNKDIFFGRFNTLNPPLITLSSRQLIMYLFDYLSGQSALKTTTA